MVVQSFDAMNRVRIHPTAKIGEGARFFGEVVVGKDVHLGSYCVIGYPAIEDFLENLEYDGMATRIGSSAKIGSYVVIHNGAEVGKNVLIDDGCVIGSESVIGNRTRIYYGARIYWKVRIGNNCKVAGFCCDRAIIKDSAIMMGKLIHKMSDPAAPWDNTEEPSPIVEKGACVGMDALIIGGITVGKNSYIAAGSVVTKNVRIGNVVVGTNHYSKGSWQKVKKGK